jgi:8-oxo-dGTP pyrophosphatase MutT (NUDIX family)
MRYCVHFILKEGEILLLKRKLTNPFYPGIWTPIIGKIKPKEKHYDAIVRETEEETGLKIEKPQFINHCVYDNDEYWFYHSTITECKIVLNHENELSEFFERHSLPENLWSFFKSELEKIT